MPGTPTPRPDAAMVVRRTLIIAAQVAETLATPPPDMMAELSADWGKEERIAYADEMTKRSAERVAALRQKSLWQDMTETERAFMLTPTPEPEQYDDAAELLEAAACLLWALGHVPSIPAYDVEATPALLDSLPDAPLERLVQSAQLRPSEAIALARDAAQRWNWRSRMRYRQESGQFDGWRGAKGMTIEAVIKLSAEAAAADGLFARPIGDDYPAFGKAYRDLWPDEWAVCIAIAQQRHHALNWLSGLAPDHRWDATPTET
jgi:hypothetical protein